MASYPTLGELRFARDLFATERRPRRQKLNPTLRKLFDGTETSIEFDEVGYRLTNAEHVVFVEPAPWTRTSDPDA